MQCMYVMCSKGNSNRLLLFLIFGLVCTAAAAAERKGREGGGKVLERLRFVDAYVYGNA